ncbi:hypothetical protein ABIA33_006999 [Streptacidiphilus sp. MAP12-16]|uniref:hypothetical protein n=1 Tax=Streptacidiphilus sp. MAP12-16 TaxID=3156300 RepID=UPI003511436B
MPVPARFAPNVGTTIRTTLEPDQREILHQAVLRACADPYSWPQADKYELDDSVRVISTPAAIVYYVIIPEPDRHLWVFSITL